MDLKRASPSIARSSNSTSNWRASPTSANVGAIASILCATNRSTATCSTKSPARVSRAPAGGTPAVPGAPLAEKPLYIGAEIFARPAFPPPHPLAFPRAGHVEALCRALGWLDENYVASRPATMADLSRYHDLEYIEAVARADRDQSVDAAMRARFNLGTRA